MFRSSYRILLVFIIGHVFVSESFVIHRAMDKSPRCAATLCAEAVPGSNSCNDEVEPTILPAFPAAANPRYIYEGPVGEGDFIVSRFGEPTAEELSNENMLQIVKMQCSDLEVNTLVWKCLGYRFENGEWTNTKCFPNWREKYPNPPDFLGMQRIYTKEIDQVSLRSNQALVRSIPLEHKQQLRKHLRPMGWNGYKIKELVPNKTRRAQCANWLLYYREELFGYSVEELREKRRRKQEEEEIQKKAVDDEWKPPVTEVF